MSTATKTTPLGNRVDAELKREFDSTAEKLGLSSTAAITVFMKRFVADGGFPFEVRVPVPTREQFTDEMAARYDRMLAGHESEHDLVEV